ncbi:MAG: aminopeptidase P family protein [Rhodospirillaceae bacterium]
MSETGVPGGRAERLSALRKEIGRRGLDGFVVPHADEHQGEYLPAGAERLAWLTGFTGSAGLAVVTVARAVIFTDGRYTLQVRAEVGEAVYEFRHLISDPLSDWLIGALPEGGRIGYDPRLHTANWVEKTRARLERAGIALLSLAENPLDTVWTDRPPPPLAPVIAHPPEFAGRSSADKRAAIAADLRRNGISAAVLSQPDSIAWLLNIRGGDVPHTPLPLCFAIIGADGGVELFIDRRKLTVGLETEHFGPDIAIFSPGALGQALIRAGRGGRRVRIDAMSASSWLLERLIAAGAVLDRGSDPCVLPKACKNPVELEGARAAHRRDGVAMVRFLHWLAEAVSGGGVTEIAAAERLLAFRSEGALFRDLSFETISAAGSNGAIVHYRADPGRDRTLESGTLYLVDSGAQYLDGTTDVTRTMALGPPDAGMREHFTRVLKGHIALATVIFPNDTTGSQLDSLARRPLWDVGLDYDHGTGHGVGSYLSVHEGPQRISKAPNRTELQPGMILSNEPGCYVPGAYGIRIENLQAVREHAPAVGDGFRPMLGFETLTLVPIDRALIEPALLTSGEREWLNAYHGRVHDTLAPLLEPAPAAWLAAATAPIS